MAALVDSAQLGPRPSRLPTHAWATPVVASAEPPSLAPVRESPLSADEQAMLNDVERAGVCSYFVEGAPATITRNIETADGLVNGCDAALYSLTLPVAGRIRLQRAHGAARGRARRRDGVGARGAAALDQRGAERLGGGAGGTARARNESDSASFTDSEPSSSEE